MSRYRLGCVVWLLVAAAFALCGCRLAPEGSHLATVADVGGNHSNEIADSGGSAPADAGDGVAASGDATATSALAVERWRIPLQPGEHVSGGFGSSGNRLYTCVTSSDPGAISYLLAVDAVAGMIAWKRELGAFACLPPLVDSSGVVTVPYNVKITEDPEPVFRAIVDSFDSNGSLRWQFAATEAKNTASSRLGWVSAAAARSASGVTYLVAGDHLHAIGDDGKLKWKVDVGPSVIEPDGPAYVSVDRSPVLTTDGLYVAGADGALRKVALDGQVQGSWAGHELGNCPPLRAGAHVALAADGKIARVDPMTLQASWSKKTVVLFSGRCAVATADGAIVLAASPVAWLSLDSSGWDGLVAGILGPAQTTPIVDCDGAITVIQGGWPTNLLTADKHGDIMRAAALPVVYSTGRPWIVPFQDRIVLEPSGAIVGIDFPVNPPCESAWCSLHGGLGNLRRN